MRIGSYLDIVGTSTDGCACPKAIHGAGLRRTHRWTTDLLKRQDSKPADHYTLMIK